MLLHTVQSLGKPEISEEDMIRGGEENIFCLDVTMNHAMLMEIIYAATNLDKYLTSLVFRKPSLDGQNVLFYLHV